MAATASRTSQRVKYGVFVPQGWRLDLKGVPGPDQWQTVLSVAGRGEAAGFGSLWAYDHFHTVPTPQQEATLECWALMAALASSTKNVRLGQMVTSIGYRPPGLLAKMAATVDVISGGRLDVGLGAGWYEHEYHGYGYDFPRAGLRLSMLREYVSVVKALWTQDEVTHAGEHYRLDGAINRPRPLQQPHPPLWIGGGGERVTLRIVAEEADYSNFEYDIDLFIHKSAVLERHCEDVGRDFSEIRRSFHVEILVDESEAAVAAKFDRICEQRGMAPAEIEARALIGTPDQIAESLARLEDAGCDTVLCYFSDAVWGDGIEMFGSEIIGKESNHDV